MQPDEIGLAAAAAAYMAIRCYLRGRAGQPTADPTESEVAPLEWDKTVPDMRAYVRSHVDIALLYPTASSSVIYTHWQVRLRELGWMPNKQFYFAKRETPALSYTYESAPDWMRDQADLVITIARTMARILA